MPTPSTVGHLIAVNRHTFYETHTFGVDVKLHSAVDVGIVGLNVDNIAVSDIFQCVRVPYSLRNHYKGYSYYDDAFDMKNGKNEIEVSEKQPLISLVAKDGYYFTSVNDGTTEYTDQSVNEIKLSVVDGMVLKVVTTAIVRDKKALVYVDDRSATSSMVFSRGDNNRIEIGTGYNELEFYKGDNPFSVTVYASTKLKVVYFFAVMSNVAASVTKKS